MARKSRSKQRSKGAGSRSQGAGKSKGGSRSSAGSKGGSKSGGNKGGSGKSGGGKSSGGSKSGGNKSGGNKRGSGKAGQGTVGGGQKTNPTKKTTPTTNVSTTTVNTKTKQGKDKTPAQISASKRIAEGKTISDVKAANLKKVQDAARIRDQKFKQTGVQTLGGKKTEFTKAEQAKIKAAGYTVDGYSKAAARSDADVDAFRAAAKAKQEAEAAAKKKAADEKLARQFDPSRLLAGVKNAFTGENLSSGDLRNPLNAPNYLAAAGAGYTDAVIGGLNFAKNLIPGVKNLRNIPTLPKYADKNLQNVRNISAVGIPLAQGVGAVKRFMSVDPISGKAGFANEIAKMTVSDAAFKAGKVPQLTKTGITNVNPMTIAKAFTPDMVATGPTAGASTALYGGMLAGAASQQARELKAGGLNIGGGVDSGEASTGKPSGLARVIAGGADKIMRDTTDFDRRGKEKNFLADAFVQANTALKTVKPYFDAAKGQDDRSIRKQMSNLATDIGAREELAPIARGIEAARTDNPNVPNILGMETLSDIRDAFTPGKPKIPSIDPKSGLVMSIGNRMLAGDLKNIVKEADQQTGVEKGATRTLGQTFNVGKQIVKNLGDTSTQGYKSAQKIKKLVDTASGKPTPGSILKGVNPFRRSGGGSTPSFTPSSAPSFTPSGRSGGGGTPVGQVPQVPPTTQFQVPEIPQQQGLDAGNLANIQNESYQNTFKNLMAINPNYSARFQMRRRRGGRRGSFKRSFSRRFFR